MKIEPQYFLCGVCQFSNRNRISNSGGRARETTPIFPVRAGASRRLLYDTFSEALVEITICNTARRREKTLPASHGVGIR
jgi:hypothetical protein